METATNNRGQYISDRAENMTRRVRAFLPLQLQYIAGVYLLCIFFRMIFRVAVFFVHCFSTLSDFNLLWLVRSLIVGVRFDTMVICGLLSPFVLLMILTALFNYNKRWIHRPLHLILSFCCAILFVLSLADMCYFTYFGTHIDILVLSRFSSPSYFFEVLFNSPVYLVYVLIFLVCLAWFAWLMFCLYNATLHKTIAPYDAGRHVLKSLFLGIICCALCFVGIRGRITDKKALSISSAYFCDNDFFNQLGVGSEFSIVKSYKEEYRNPKPKLPYIDPIKAKQIVSQEFANRDDIPVKIPQLSEDLNVVVVLMNNITLERVKGKTMPTLYDILRSSMSFDNVYADGSEYNSGIFSVLFAYPDVCGSNYMNSAVIPKLNGLPTLFKQRGCRTFFFSSEAQSSDNTSRFLKSNDIDVILSGMENDHVDKIIETLNKEEKRFFACVYIGNKTGKALDTDRKIQKIISKASRSVWYSNTLFVFAGSNSYNEKVPLCFYYPKKIKPSKNSALASLVDVAPTLMSMVDNSFRSNAMGINIFTERRSFVTSCKKDEFCVRNDSLIYKWSSNGREYSNCDKRSRVQMKEYGLAMFQTADFAITQKKIKQE